MDQATKPGQDTTTALIEQLEYQLQLYQQLQGLAQRQRALIIKEDPQPLLKLLGQRQELVNRLGAVAERLEPLRSTWQTEVEQVPAERRDRVQQLLRHSQQALQSIIAIDADDGKILAARKTQVASNRSSSGENKKAFQAYQQNESGKRERILRTDESA